jgi:calcineurin-like phosphoesterase family protein
MKFVLEYDDLHFMEPENCIETIDRFVERYPDIKISFFTIPFLRGFPINGNEQWAERIREHIKNNNVRLALHGLHHTPEEFKFFNYDQSIACLTMAESLFNEADLPFVKVFRGPHWGLCEGAVNALIRMKYTHLYNHEDYRELGDSVKNKIKVKYYNWNLTDEPPERGFLDSIAGKPIITHGHTHDVCGNGIGETFDKVCNFIDNNNVDFKFVNEV